jgi:aquaporin Z
MAGVTLASLASEFAGTFLLVFTVGCNVLSGNAVWGGVSIACVLMVSIYALGAASGANFNPAVSFALGLANKMEEGWKQVFAYCAVQILGAIVAGCGYSLLFNREFNLQPSKGFGWWEVVICEVAYTFMLVFAVLNTAASKKLGGKNQFYGLTIAFSIIAGAYGAGAVSGGCFNPAVAIGIDISSVGSGFGWCGLYAGVELVAAGLAVVAFKIVRPEEGSSDDPPVEYGLASKLVSEFLGTFFLVLTVGLNVLAESKAAAFSIAASLMVMINSTGDVSGGHYNPAVTVAILVGGRDKIDVQKACLYIPTQIVGAIAAAFVYAAVHHGETFALGPVGAHNWFGVAFAEIIFTFVLTFVVLCVATVKSPPAPEFIGFIIGSCVTVGGFAIGKVSGGSLNPAVSFGIASAQILNGGLFFKALIYSAFEIIGGVMAAIVFRVVYPDEYSGLDNKAM